MIERELEVIDRAVDESSDIAVNLANLRDAVDAMPAEQIKQALTLLIEQADGVADALTALSIDLTNVNNSLKREQ